MSVSVLRLDRVTRRCRDGARQIAVLEQVSLRLRAAESVGIVGERRSGKTTLLRVAAGIEPPDAGSVLFDGLPARLGVAMAIASEDVAAVAGLPSALSLSDGRLASSRAAKADVIQFPVARARGGSEGR